MPAARTSAAKALSSSALAAHLLGDREPAEAVGLGDLGRVVRPDGVVAGPDALDHGVALERAQALVNRVIQPAEALVRRARAAGLGLDRLVQRGEQRGEVLLERREAFVEELRGNRLEVDAGLARVFQGLLRRLQLVDQAGVELAVVEEGIDRRLRQRVHRVGQGELFDVEDVRVGRVLRAGGAPERPLDARACRRQTLPALRGGERSRKSLIGGVGVGDGDLAPQRRIGRQLVVHLGVDAGDEERGDAGDAVDGQAGGETALQARHVGQREALVDVDVEEQRDVDVDARGDELLDGARAFGDAGDLDHQVGPADRAPHALRLVDHRLGVPACASKET